MVGKVAVLEMHHHQVAGEIRIIDNCRFEVVGFTYDGEVQTFTFTEAPIWTYLGKVEASNLLRDSMAQSTKTTPLNLR